METIQAWPNGLVTLSYSGTRTGTGTGTDIMQNISHFIGWTQ